MNKAVRVVVATVVAVATFSTVRPTPAGAVDLCAGTGWATPGQALSYPGFGPPRNTTLGISLTTGACASGRMLGSLTASISGPLGGAHCGLLDGWGTVNGRGYFFYGIGSLLVFQGGLVGVANMTEDPSGGSCAGAGQRRFLVSGALVVT